MTREGRVFALATLLSACDIASARAPAPPWKRHPGAAHFVHIEPLRSLGPAHFFALFRAYSRFDEERALRLLVFRVKGRRTIDLWRGTALARPLVTARVVRGTTGERLCAIHRGDSFYALNPKTPERVRAIYRWTGFGFIGDRDPVARASCDRIPETAH